VNQELQLRVKRFLFCCLQKLLNSLLEKKECPKEVSLQENLSESAAILPAVTDGEVNLHPTTSATLASNAQSADCEATSEDDDITVLDTKVYLFKLVSVT